MAAAHSFTDLLFWQRGRQWSKRIFELTERERFHGDRRLVEQINDSSDSATAVWELYERITGKPRPAMFRGPEEA